MPKITALELENFQTIGARTVIPIRDLTLVFGPNGAGKSAIFDAIDLLQRVTSSDWGRDGEYLTGLLERHCRKAPTNASPPTLGVNKLYYAGALRKYQSNK
jgi:recombinational DNA repair ATPase RecF